MHLTVEDSDFGDSLLRKVAGLDAPACEHALATPRPGDRLGGEGGGRFEILEEIGAGSMSVVYRAHDCAVARTVALKLLRHCCESPREEVLALFRREARATRRLAHRNVVRIFGADRWNDTPFLVLELLEGAPLSALIRRGPLPWESAARILIQIAGGIAHAHERGVIHRDLKPGNVLMLPDETAKIIDFGLAHLTPDPEPEGAGALPRAGTPSYMAPEQWLGLAQDARTDTWALGVVLFEMLTGRRPHEGAELEDLKAQVTSAAPAPSARALRVGLPDAAEEILARALQKDPARRFQTAHEMQCALVAARRASAPRLRF